ncbi:MAG: division/cell wall cluster transcriptional repressor MraZ [Bacilli bacterium]
MFLGSYDYSIDDKGRLVIPSKFRNEIGEKLYLLKGFDGCLSIYKEVDFQRYISKLQNLPFEKSKTRLHLRILLNTIVELNVDNSGRIQIPTKTLQQYSIGKSVKIIGLIDHFEVWDVDSWMKYREDNEKNFEKDAEDLLKNEE